MLLLPLRNSNKAVLIAYFLVEQNSGTGAKYRTKKDHMMCKLVCLSVAYSSTIGGLTTITGTSTNLIFAEHFNM